MPYTPEQIAKMRELFKKWQSLIPEVRAAAAQVEKEELEKAEAKKQKPVIAQSRTDVFKHDTEWIHNNKHKLYKGNMEKFAQGANVEDKKLLYDLYKKDLDKGIHSLKFDIFLRELNLQTHGLKGGELYQIILVYPDETTKKLSKENATKLANNIILNIRNFTKETNVQLGTKIVITAIGGGNGSVQQKKSVPNLLITDKGCVFESEEGLSQLIQLLSFRTYYHTIYFEEVPPPEQPENTRKYFINVRLRTNKSKFYFSPVIQDMKISLVDSQLPPMFEFEPIEPNSEIFNQLSLSWKTCQKKFLKLNKRRPVLTIPKTSQAKNLRVSSVVTSPMKQQATLNTTLASLNSYNLYGKYEGSNNIIIEITPKEITNHTVVPPVEVVPASKPAIDEDSIVKVNEDKFTFQKITYDTQSNNCHARQCLWNILRSHGISEVILEQIQGYNDFVDADINPMQNLFETLNKLLQKNNDPRRFGFNLIRANLGDGNDDGLGTNLGEYCPSGETVHLDLAVFAYGVGSHANDIPNDQQGGNFQNGHYIESEKSMMNRPKITQTRREFKKPKVLFSAAIPESPEIGAEFDCRLSLDFCVQQWGGKGMETNHWCKLASFLTVALNLPGSRSILLSKGLDPSLPLDHDKNLFFMRELIVIKKSFKKERDSCDPDKKKYKQVDIIDLNEIWELGLKINRKEYLIKDLILEIAPENDAACLQAIRSNIANTFMKSFDSQKQKIIILGFKGLKGSALNHYCVLNKVNRYVFNVFDPIIKENFLDVQLALPFPGTLPNTEEKGAHLTTSTISGNQGGNIGLLFKYYVIEL